jgi:hypothetical protein
MLCNQSKWQDGVVDIFVFLNINPSPMIRVDIEKGS